MTTGHIAWAFVPTESMAGQLMHFFGRLTIPLACFLVVEGFERTHDLSSYLKRMFGFAILAQIPYVMSFVGVYRLIAEPSWLWVQLNVLFTLGLAIIVLIFLKKFKSDTWANKPLWLIGIVLLGLLSSFCDWGVAVIVWVLAIYHYRAVGFALATIGFFVIGFWDSQNFFAMVRSYQLMDYGLFLAVPVMLWYDRYKQHSPKAYRLPKTLFYWYYAIHLLVLGLLVQYSPWAIDEYQMICHQSCDG